MPSRRIVTSVESQSSPERVALTRYFQTALGAGRSTAEVPEARAAYSQAPMSTAKIKTAGRMFFINGEAGFRVVVRSAAAGSATEIEMVADSSGAFITQSAR